MSKITAKISIIALVSFPFVLLAAEGHNHKHEEKSSVPAKTSIKHKAHVHGMAKLDVTIEGKKASFEFEIPGMDAFGFETEAKSPEQKKKQDDVQALVKTSLDSLVKFDPKLQCTTQIESMEISGDDHHEHSSKAKTNKHSEHSEFEIDLDSICPTLIAGSTIQISLKKLFPTVGDVKVQIIADDQQLAVTLKDGEGSLKIPPEVTKK